MKWQIWSHDVGSRCPVTVKYFISPVGEWWKVSAIVQRKFGELQELQAELSTSKHFLEVSMVHGFPARAGCDPVSRPFRTTRLTFSTKTVEGIALYTEWVKVASSMTVHRLRSAVFTSFRRFTSQGALCPAPSENRRALAAMKRFVSRVGRVSATSNCLAAWLRHCITNQRHFHVGWLHDSRNHHRRHSPMPPGFCLYKRHCVVVISDSSSPKRLDLYRQIAYRLFGTSLLRKDQVSVCL